jgi:hypothetical protein
VQLTAAVMPQRATTQDIPIITVPADASAILALNEV